MAPSRTEGLCGTCITLEFVEEKLQIIGGSLGFMSEIFRVKQIEWSSDEDLPKTVVVKVPTGQNAQKHMESMFEHMDQETIDGNVNMDMAEFLSDGNKKESEAMRMLEGSPGCLVPKVYYYQCATKGSSEVTTMMIMEDMSEGSAHVNLAEGLTVEQMHACVEQIATLHATSHQWKHSWMGKFMPNKSPDVMQEEITGFINTMKGITKSLKVNYPELTDLVDRVLPHFTMEKFFSGMMSHLMIGMPPVLVHGDLWVANILFEADIDNRASSKVHSVFDWATAHPGNGAEDIARLLMSSVNGELRRKETPNALRLYREKFAEAIGKDAPFTEEQLFKAYDACLPPVMMFTVFGVPLWMNIPEITNSPDPKVKQARLDEMVDRAKMMMHDYLEVHEEK